MFFISPSSAYLAFDGQALSLPQFKKASRGLRTQVIFAGCTKTAWLRWQIGIEQLLRVHPFYSGAEY